MLQGGPRAERVTTQLRNLTARQNALPVSTFWMGANPTAQQRLYSAGMALREQLRERVHNPGLVQGIKDWFRPAQRKGFLARFNNLDKNFGTSDGAASWRRIFELGRQQSMAQPLPFTHYHDKIIADNSLAAQLFKLFRPGFGSRSLPKLTEGVDHIPTGSLEMFKVRPTGAPLRFSPHVASAEQTLTTGRAPGGLASSAEWKGLDPNNWRGYPFYETVLRGQDLASTLTHTRSLTPAAVGDSLRALLQKIPALPQSKNLTNLGVVDKWRTAARAYEAAPTVRARELPVVPSKVVWKGQGGEGFKPDGVTGRSDHYWFSGHPEISSGYAFKNSPDVLKAWTPSTVPQVSPALDIGRALQTKITTHPVYSRLLKTPSLRQ